MGPVYAQDPARAPALLASCYERALGLCRELSLASIAFPAISTGVYGYPIDAAADAMDGRVPPSTTQDIPLLGAEGYTLALQLVLLNTFAIGFTFIPLHVMRIEDRARQFTLFTFSRSAATLLLRIVLVVGFGSGAMTLYFQITIAEQSALESRGSALALGGLGWGLSHLSTPLVMGFLADRLGIVYGFYAVGLFALACTAAIAAARRWAFAGASAPAAP